MTTFYEEQHLDSSTTLIVPVQFVEAKRCLACNTSFIVQTSVTNEFGAYYLQNIERLMNLHAGSIEDGDLITENQPFCPDCRQKLEECFRLLQDLETITFELEKIRNDIGKSVVESLTTTSYLRTNYSVKHKIFQQYYQKFLDLPNLPPEVTVSTSDFSDLLKTNPIDDFSSNFQNEPLPVTKTTKERKKASGKRKNVSKAKKTTKKTAENVTSDPEPPIAKSTRLSKRKSSLGIQNNVEQIVFEDDHFETIANCDDDNDNLKSSVDEFELPTNNNTVNEACKTDISPQSKKAKYQCRFCEKCCSKSNHLVIHERMHTDERPFPCSICGKAFREKGHVLRHEKIHDASRLLGEKTHLCPECGKAFVLADSLYNHRREKHMGKPQKRNIVSQMCETCGKVLHSMKSLKKHVMIIHEKQKPHSCPTCDKKFSYLCNKKLHIERHHRIKCTDPSCTDKEGQIFESREIFEFHFKSEHPDKVLPPADEPRKGPKKSKETFNCSQCDRVFKLNKWLEEHVQKVHSKLNIKKTFERRKVNDNPKKATKKSGRKTKFQKSKSIRKKPEVKTELESDNSNMDCKPQDYDSLDEKKFDISLEAGYKGSPPLATKVRRKQRTASESENDMTEREESDEENEDYDWRNNDIINSSLDIMENVTVKEEPQESDFDNK